MYLPNSNFIKIGRKKTSFYIIYLDKKYKTLWENYFFSLKKLKPDGHSFDLFCFSLILMVSSFEYFYITQH